MDSSYLANQSEVSKLKELIKQRDNEISILYRRFEQRCDIVLYNDVIKTGITRWILNLLYLWQLYQ